MRLGISLAVTLSLLLSACSTPRQTQTDSRAANEVLSPPAPYVRIAQPDSNVVQLQIAVRQFAPARRPGPAVWLAGVSHLGESNYYAVLQQHLDAQTLVLFEGIRDEAARTPETTNSEDGSAPRATQTGGWSLQSSMAAALGLVFQLEAIHYDRPNFRNSDLSVHELRQLLAEQRAAPGQPGAGPSFESLLQVMQGDSFLDSVLQLGLRFLGANPRLQALGKLALLETIAQIQGDPAQLRGLSPELKQLLDVLVQQRNQKVIDDLRDELKELGPRDSVAIFYGTGHMPDLESRLRQELHYRPVGQRWLTAFSVNLAQAGISDTERQFIHNFVKGALEEPQP